MGLGLPLILLFIKGDIFFDPEHIFQPETLKEAVYTRYNHYKFRPVILLNVARYLTTSLRGPAQPYTDERASASLNSEKIYDKFCYNWMPQWKARLHTVI